MSKRMALSWTLSLVLFPINALLMVVVLGFGLVPDAGRWEYMASISGTIYFIFFALLNILFSLYTIVTFWKEYSAITRGKFFLYTVLLNALSAYYFASTWKSRGVDPYTIKNKKVGGIFNVICFFILFVGISLPLFVASKKF